MSLSAFADKTPANFYGSSSVDHHDRPHVLVVQFREAATDSSSVRHLGVAHRPRSHRVSRWFTVSNWTTTVPSACL